MLTDEFLFAGLQERFPTSFFVDPGFRVVRENLENLENKGNFQKVRENLEKSGNFCEKLLMSGKSQGKYFDYYNMFEFYVKVVIIYYA